jgi:hypothetical protein
MLEMHRAEGKRQLPPGLYSRGRERRPRVDAISELWKTEATNLERELNAEISIIWRRVRQHERIAIGPD